MPLLGSGFRGIYFVTFPQITVYEGLNQAGGYFNGVKLCGSIGVQHTGDKPWFNITRTKDLFFILNLNGSLATDVSLNIECCLIGGENSPTVIANVNPVSGIVKIEEPDIAYDRIRVNVLALSEDGKGSQVLVSGR